MGKWTDGRKMDSINGYMNELMDWWIKVWENGQMDEGGKYGGQMDGRVEGQPQGWLQEGISELGVREMNPQAHKLLSINYSPSLDPDITSATRVV